MKAEGLPATAATKLDDLVERYHLVERRRAQLEEVLLALAGDERAPTTVRDPARAIDIHLADSLVALEVEAVHAARRIADLGAGAGFPGLALAVALPATELCLVESHARKCAFIAGLIARAEVSNARVVGA